MPKFLSTTVFAIVFCAPIWGCGSAAPTQSKDVIQANTPKSNADLKARLQKIADAGEAGSALMGIRPSIEEMSDKELSAKLLVELKKLEASTRKEDIKANATKMAAML